MGGTKGTAMPVVAHGGLEFLDALLGFFLGGQGCCGSGSSDRVRAVDGVGLQRGEQGIDLQVLGGRGGSELVHGCTTVSGGRGNIVEVHVELCHHILGGERHGGSSTIRGMGGHRVGDAVRNYGQVGGAKGVATLRQGAKLPLYCTVEGEKLQLPGCTRLGRRDKTISGGSIVREVIGGE